MGYKNKEEWIMYYPEIEAIEKELRDKNLVSNFDTDQWKKQFLSAVEILKRKNNGESVKKIAGSYWGREWVEKISIQYLRDELDCLVEVEEPEMTDEEREEHNKWRKKLIKKGLIGGDERKNGTRSNKTERGGKNRSSTVTRGR